MGSMVKHSLNTSKTLVSVSKSAKLNGAYHRHFRPVEISSLSQLAELMSARIWSPIVWTDGLRLRQNYISCGYVALDFDDGRISIAETIETLEETNLAYIIGTSKSHQITKTTKSGVVHPAVDRFRLVFPCDSEQTSRDIYEYNMRSAMEIWPCDESCKDAARFFYACKEIVKIREGESFSWLEIPEELNPETLKQRSIEQLRKYREEGSVPSWVERVLKNGAGLGERHYYCYRLGATLIQLGYDEKQIIGLVMKSPLKDIGLSEVERAVANGAERAIRDIASISRGGDRDSQARF